MFLPPPLVAFSASVITPCIVLEEDDQDALDYIMPVELFIERRIMTFMPPYLRMRDHGSICRLRCKDSGLFALERVAWRTGFYLISTDRRIFAVSRAFPFHPSHLDSPPDLVKAWLLEAEDRKFRG